jgi:hypothetical protein
MHQHVKCTCLPLTLSQDNSQTAVAASRLSHHAACSPQASLEGGEAGATCARRQQGHVNVALPAAQCALAAWGQSSHKLQPGPAHRITITAAVLPLAGRGTGGILPGSTCTENVLCQLWWQYLCCSSESDAVTCLVTGGDPRRRNTHRVNNFLHVLQRCRRGRARRTGGALTGSSD